MYRKLDVVDVFAVLLLAVGLGALAWGIDLQSPASFDDLFLNQFGDWTSGLIIDGVLLLVLNRVIRNHERNRVINQVASLSNEFALDAVRRCRAEGWLHEGIMEGRQFGKARLATADLSDARLARSDLSFADLSGAELTHADLAKCTLIGANFSGADLRWADLKGADLSWADLRGAQLDGARLDGIRTSFTAIDGEHEQFADFRDAVVGGLLTPKQVDLVQASFERLLTQGDKPIVRFYEHLFETAPALRGLFSGDMERQARKFLQSLKVIVSSLSATEKAVPVLQKLGTRHEGYGVEPRHYEVVGQVLIETLDESLGDQFTVETRDAWVRAFELISSLMRGQAAKTPTNSRAAVP